MTVRVATGPAVTGGGGGGTTDPGPLFSYANVALSPYNGNIQSALNVAKHVYVPGPATYTVTAELVARFDKQLVEFGEGVILKVGTGSGVSSVLSAIDLDRVRFLGKDTEIDLNNVGLTGVRNNGSSKTIKRPVVAGFYVNNNDTAAGNFAALECRKADRPKIVDSMVENYGYNGATNVYSFGFFAVTRGRMKGVDVKRSKIGFELFDCIDTRVIDFSIEDTKDNGFYCLQSGAGLGNDLKIAHGTIDASEEGVVFLVDNITLDDVTVKNCRNKGCTVRGVYNAKIVNCRFRGNLTHISDNNTNPNFDYLISGCTFEDGSTLTANFMQLRRFSRGQIIHNKFKTRQNTAALVLIAGATDGSGQDNLVAFNDFEDVNKTVASGLVRIQVDNGYASGNRVIENHAHIGSIFVYLYNPSPTIVPASGTEVRRNRLDDIDTEVFTTAGSAPANNVRYAYERLQTRPFEIPVHAWFAADQIAGLVDAAAIAQWPDLSGNARHLNQLTAGSQPTYRLNALNGLPAVRFDGTDDSMATAGFGLSQPYEVFVVGKQTATGNRTIIDGLTTNSGAISRTGTTTLGMSAGTVLTLSSNANPQDKLRLWNATFSGSSSVLRSDGASVSGAAGAGSPDGIRLGSTGGGASFFPGDIAEVLVTPLLTTSQRGGLRSYFMNKYRDSSWL